MFKKVIAIGMAAVLSLSIIACGNTETSQNQSDSNKVVVNVAYQYGLAYAPVVLCEKENLISKAYKEATGNELEIVWNQMSSGADINTGIASGNIDIGFMGVGPAVTGVANGVGYKIFTNISGQEHGLMTNTEDITSLGDLIGSDKQIALVNTGSIQHIILAKALVNNGYEAHALDANIVAMKHPDGMSALETGSIACHLTSNPYIYKERDNTSLNELTEVSDIWDAEQSFIVGVASESFYTDKKEIYDAFNKGLAEAMDYLSSNVDGAAELLSEFDGNSVEDEKYYLSVGKYTTETHGLFELATFMSDNAFIDKKFEAYSDLVFESVSGN